MHVCTIIPPSRKVARPQAFSGVFRWRSKTGTWGGHLLFSDFKIQFYLQCFISNRKIFRLRRYVDENLERTGNFSRLRRSISGDFPVTQNRKISYHIFRFLTKTGTWGGATFLPPSLQLQIWTLVKNLQNTYK